MPIGRQFALTERKERLCARSDATLAMTVIRHSEERSDVGIPQSVALRTSYRGLPRFARNDVFGTEDCDASLAMTP